MAQLKDLIVNGASRLIGDAFANKITIQTLADSTNSIGTDGQMLKSNGTNITWSALPTASTTAAGIIQIGTGSTNAAAGDHTHSQYLQLAGGTMTGALTLSGNPTSNLHAATKQYVDSVAGDYVLKAGDTMTGSLYVNVTTDTSATADTGAIVVGNKAGENIAIDANEIIARNNKATSTLFLNNDGGAIQSGGTIQPKSDSSVDIGTTSLHWRHGYFDDLFVSTDTGYTATNSAKAGTAITTGAIDITTATPKINFHRATAAAVTGYIQSETNYGITINGTPSATGASIYLTGTAPGTGFEYTSRTIKPIVRVSGLLYSDANIESKTYFLNNTAGGNNTGYYVYGNNVQYGRLYIGTAGKAGTETTFTDETTEETITGYTGNTTGTAILEIGNNKAVGTNGTSYASPGTAGNANNARGQLRIYGAGANYTDVLAQGNGNRTCYLPNFNNTMYLIHGGNNNAIGGAETMPVYIAANGRATAITKVNVAHGGTGATSFTANSIIMSGSSTTAALTTRAVTNNTSNTAIVNNTNIPTMNTIYYGLATINNASQSRAVSIYAPTSAGTKNQILVSAGGTSVPTWLATANGAAYATSTNGALTFGTLPIAQGGTGATTAADARTNLGISYPVTSVATKTGDVTLGTLTIGNKTYNGSGDTTIEIADLGLASTTTFLGITSTNLSNESTTSPVNIVIGPTTGNVSPSNGSVVMEQDSGEEYIWTGGKWNLMGLASSWALANHIHGNILNNGTITSDTTKASGQHLVITDSNNKISRSNITLGTSTNTYLRNDGGWEAPTGDHKVTQKAAITSNGSYPVILGYSTTTSTDTTDVVNTTSTLNYNPSTQKLHVPAIEFTSASYGETLPETGTNGQVFFQLSNGYTYEIPTGGTADDILVKNSATDRDVVWTRDYVKRSGDTMTGALTVPYPFTVLAQNSTNEGGEIILKADPDTGYDAQLDVYQGSFRIHSHGIVCCRADLATGGLYGAVWNDYAEYRETKEDIEPGRCIRELGDDTLELTTERLMRGCEIVSDTFGFAIGETDKAKTPTATSGRVLAYLYEDREEAKQKIGWPVCSGPNGTVSIMTEEEEEKYPSRIIGTISAVPDYEIWHGGAEGNQDIQVNGRIWIRVK